ncbi:MAG: glycine cleavage system protein H [Lentisphaeria bacterium]
MIEFPEHLLYSHNHMWVEIEDKNKRLARIGITSFLREELPEILTVDLPMEGDQVEIDEQNILLHLEDEEDNEFRSIGFPLSGHVIEINKEVLNNPDLLHLEPYEHWIMRLQYEEPGELDLLMDADKYNLALEVLR